MNIQKIILASAVLALGLAGCGTEEQDGISSARSGNTGNAPIEGIAVDGPVVRALVFVDQNNNLKKDSFERYAYTDNDGYFSYNPKTNVAYCNVLKGTDYPSGLKFQNSPEFCLYNHTQLNEREPGRLIVTGGYDLYTGEPFEGSMSVSDFLVARKIAVTPMSTINDVLTQSGETDGLAALGLENDDLSRNFLEPVDLNEDGITDAFEGNKFSITYSMHKFVVIVSNLMETYYPEIGEEDDLPSDISSLIYKQFLNFTAGDDEVALEGIISDIDALYVAQNITVRTPPTFDQVDSEVRTQLGDVRSAITSAFGQNGAELTFANVKARVRGVEIVVLKIVRGLPHTGALTALDSDTYLEKLAGDSNDNGNINFTQIVEFDGDAAALETEAGNAAQNNGVSITELAGMSLSFEDEDPSVNSKAAIFFTSNETGDEEPTKGEIHLCLQYEGSADVDLDGNYISGSWDTIPALNNTVLLKMNIFGGTSAVLKKVGVDGNGATQYRFDYANKITKFSSSEDFQKTAELDLASLNLESIPNSNETCQTYLGINAAQ